jgi:hypothetical protein
MIMIFIKAKFRNLNFQIRLGQTEYFELQHVFDKMIKVLESFEPAIFSIEIRAALLNGPARHID